MTDVVIPAVRPARPFFSSGPCAKRPGWTPEALNAALLSRSHRSKPGKARLKEAIDRNDRNITLAAPVFDVPAELGIREELIERRSFLGAVVAPIDSFVQHFREEGRVGAGAQAEHLHRLW